MNLPELCIRRPVMTTLLMAAFVIFGVIAYANLPVSELPSVEFPTIQVTAQLPGASPETMAAAVATPLQGQFATIAGLDSMNSVSAQGVSSITLSFALTRDIDAAAQDVQSALAVAQRRLPVEMTVPPSFRKVNPADAPIFFLAMSSDTLPLSVVNEYAETQLAQRLSTITGVALVTVFGSQKYAVRVQVDPNKLAAAGVGLDEVQAAIAQGNVNKPTGIMEGSRQVLAVRSNGQLETAAAYRGLTVVYRNGAPLKLEAVADLVDSVENTRAASWYKGKRAIVLAIYRQPGTNTVDTVDAIKRVLPSFQAKLPPSVNIETFFDRTLSIRAAIHDVKFTLVLAAVLVVLVIFLFLRNLSATLIPSIALPISVIGTFALMHALGYSLDNLSLLALTLAVGFVVDDAIVMLENIVRHIEDGMAPMEAALKGSKEIGFTIISMTLSLIAVFIPVMFMSGIVGRLLHEFAVTICAAILVSAFVSLTLTPMMCSRFVKSHKGEKHNWMFNLFERGYDALLLAYDTSLKWALRWRAVVMVVFVATFGVTVWLYQQVPKEFLPSGDTGFIQAFTEGGQDASFAAMAERQLRLAEIVAADPDVSAVNSTVGAGGPRATSNNGSMFIRLKPTTERKAKPAEIIGRLRGKTAGVPGIRISFQNPPPIRIGGLLTSAQYQYTLQGSDLDELYDWSGKFLTRFRKIEGLQDVSSNLFNNSPTLSLEIDRDKLPQLGLTVGQVQEALTSSFSTRQISTIYGSTAQYQVILEVAPEFQDDPTSLSRIYVRSSTRASWCRSTTVARVTRKNQVLTVNHSRGNCRRSPSRSTWREGVALGDAVDRIRAGRARDENAGLAESG